MKTVKMLAGLAAAFTVGWLLFCGLAYAFLGLAF